MSYSEFLSRTLASKGAVEGSSLSVITGDRVFQGTLMPHNEFNGENTLILKMKSGYNVGVRVSETTDIQVLSPPVERHKPETVVEEVPGLPKIVLIGTGGTIASFVDYRTGAVHPALSTSDMIDSVPEIRDLVNVDAKVLFSIFSENMSIEHWQKLAEAVATELNNGADAVLIPHGTDTMGYTAAALSFMLGDLTKPVVLVGAQRSSDRPSSDASSNLLAATRFCIKGNRAGVFVMMHDTLGDDSFAAHIGTRVRKMHTSRRDAFHSINCQPAAHLDREGAMTVIPGTPISKTEVKVSSALEPSVVLLQYYPGMDASLFEDVILKSKGIVFAGTGLGHVNSDMIPLIRKATEQGTIVAITSQCLNGSTNLNVYDTGRDMQTAGAVTLGDMLPETAYIKLMWVLANTKDVDEAKAMMITPLAGEMGTRRTVND